MGPTVHVATPRTGRTAVMGENRRLKREVNSGPDLASVVACVRSAQGPVQRQAATRDLRSAGLIIDRGQPDVTGSCESAVTLTRDPGVTVARAIATGDSVRTAAEQLADDVLLERVRALPGGDSLEMAWDADRRVRTLTSTKPEAITAGIAVLPEAGRASRAARIGPREARCPRTG